MTFLLQMITAVEPRQNDTVLKVLKCKLLKEMNTRFQQVESVRTYAVATLLDPRFKRMYFTSPRADADAVTWISTQVIVFLKGFKNARQKLIWGGLALRAGLLPFLSTTVLLTE